MGWLDKPIDITVIVLLVLEADRHSISVGVVDAPAQ